MQKKRDASVKRVNRIPILNFPTVDADTAMRAPKVPHVPRRIRRRLTLRAAKKFMKMNGTPRRFLPNVWKRLMRNFYEELEKAIADGRIPEGTTFTKDDVGRALRKID